MIMFTSYIILFCIISGLVLTKPIEETTTNKSNTQDIPMDDAFRQAELVLDRYFKLIDSDADQLVHAMLHIIMNNPTSFPYVPRRALDIAMKNLVNKMGQDDVDILTKPILSSIEQNARNKPKQPSSYHLTDEEKHEIEEALDKFFEEQNEAFRM